jgi:hypothetical protein
MVLVLVPEVEPLVGRHNRNVLDPSCACLVVVVVVVVVLRLEEVLHIVLVP